MYPCSGAGRLRYGAAMDGSISAPSSRLAGFRRPPALVTALLVAASTLLPIGPTASAATLPGCRFADVLATHRAYGHWRVTLLDPYYRLGSTYRPPLVPVTRAGFTSGGYVRPEVIRDLAAMRAAARAAGASFVVRSAFRSYQAQASTFRYWVRVLGYAAALRTSARAGHSEHQLGTTIDVQSPGSRAPWDYVDWGRQTRAGAWLKGNAWRYGFVMSYPAGKRAVTCYDYEPWHYRYVGREVATMVRASRLTLREWLWRNGARYATWPTPTPSPGPTPTPTPQPTPTPEPTPTPVPTPTPRPDPQPIESRAPIPAP